MHHASEAGMGKSRKEQLEAMLAGEPNDPELRYFLAMEHASAGDSEAAARQLLDVIAAHPDYVAAYLQAGQVLGRLGREEEARAVFQRGIASARQKGDLHAAGEMEGFLDALG
jgi:Tfp pilus assembly protein PilF